MNKNQMMLSAAIAGLLATTGASAKGKKHAPAMNPVENTEFKTTETCTAAHLTWTDGKCWAMPDANKCKGSNGCSGKDANACKGMDVKKDAQSCGANGCSGKDLKKDAHACKAPAPTEPAKK